MRLFFPLALLVMLGASCTDDAPTTVSVNQLFWINHKDSEMPVLLSGNEKSNYVVLAIQGGNFASAINNLHYFFKGTLEKNFLVAYWDQRYTGLSLNRNIPADIPLAQFTEDALLVVRELKARYPEKKLILFGQNSGGLLVSQFITNAAHQGLYDGWIIQNGITTNGFERFQLLRTDLIARAQRLQLNGNTAWRDSLVWMQQLTFNATTRNRALERRFNALVATLWEEDPNIADFGPFLQEPPYFNSADKARINTNGTLPIQRVIENHLYFFNQDSQINAIARPGLLLWGSLDSAFPLSYANAFKDKLGTRATLVVYPDAGQEAWGTHTQRYAGDVTAFIERIN